MIYCSKKRIQINIDGRGTGSVLIAMDTNEQDGKWKFSFTKQSSETDEDVLFIYCENNLESKFCRCMSINRLLQYKTQQKSKVLIFVLRYFQETNFLYSTRKTMYFVCFKIHRMFRITTLLDTYRCRPLVKNAIMLHL